ncbi:hypothetical protein M422DRAFT_43583 [Sphaerobolus stellatus SS14]|nr:hypothetical protein M422DRAFT_43583 [Sphaerobolus stellatus SS14]
MLDSCGTVNPRTFSTTLQTPTSIQVKIVMPAPAYSEYTLLTTFDQNTTNLITNLLGVADTSTPVNVTTTNALPTTATVTSTDATTTAIDVGSPTTTSTPTTTSNNSSHIRSSIGPIVGGVIGGIFALFLAALGCFLLLRIRRRSQEMSGPAAEERAISPLFISRPNLNNNGNRTGKVSRRNGLGQTGTTLAETEDIAPPSYDTIRGTGNSSGTSLPSGPPSNNLAGYYTSFASMISTPSHRTSSAVWEPNRNSRKISS